MVFTRYFFARFFKYFLSISALLACIVNFIEFFEKIVHVRQASIHTILNFVGINLIPSFFDLLPIACWLASCLLIKEFYQQNEWESLALLNINNRTLLKLAFYVGLSVACLSFVFREVFVERMIFSSEQFKMENFKQKSAQKIMGRWLEIATNIFAYFSMLDFSTNSGTDLMLLFINPDFSIQKVLSGQTFEIKPENNEIIIRSGASFDVDSNLQEKFLNKHLTLPTFFSQIKINFEPATLFNLLKNFANKRILPPAVQRSLQHQITNKLAFYLKFILYPLLTFALFIFFWHAPILKWVAIFAPYPLFVGYSILSDFMFSVGINPWLLLIFYFLILLVTYLIFFTNFIQKWKF
ncbi:MAG: hypothetical protein US22_C0032G0002 [candidate division TM6 bacterium GW2011_GWF2_36_6]|nr:MAG: hypothetical protein US22_C0032G0002 [candidate division TM6 bacterium GW2011_GWF2_36_6]